MWYTILSSFFFPFGSHMFWWKVSFFNDCMIQKSPVSINTAIEFDLIPWDVIQRAVNLKPLCTHVLSFCQRLMDAGPEAFWQPSRWSVRICMASKNPASKSSDHLTSPTSTSSSPLVQMIVHQWTIGTIGPFISPPIGDVFSSLQSNPLICSYPPVHPSLSLILQSYTHYYHWAKTMPTPSSPASKFQAKKVIRKWYVTCNVYIPNDSSWLTLPSQTQIKRTPLSPNNFHYLPNQKSATWTPMITMHPLVHPLQTILICLPLNHLTLPSQRS